MKKIIRFVGLLGGLTLLGCGGGGGSSSGNYAGTWDVRAVRVINDCGLAVDTTFASTIVVNQDGDRVVVNSGRLVLEGAVNDKDGFTVATTTTTSNGCQGGFGYSFQNAGDGQADVGVAITARCNGTRECSVGYGGTGTRLSGKSVTDKFAGGTDIDGIVKSLEAATLGGGGDEAQGTAEESAANLADLSAPAN